MSRLGVGRPHGVPGCILLVGMGHLQHCLFGEGRPLIWRPIGSPWELNPQLMEMAGALARLKGLVMTRVISAAISLEVITGSSANLGATALGGG